MKKSIRIPDPCNENWNEMTPTEKGAFCQVCSKEVVDFRNSSQEEIIEKLNSATGRVCGRFKEDQLNQDKKESTSIKSRPYLSKAAAALAMFLQLFNSKDTNALEIHGGFIDLNSLEKSEQDFSELYKMIEIKGKIVDENGVPIPYVTISHGTKDSAIQPVVSSDVDGLFKFGILKTKLMSEGSTMHFQSSGYETRTIENFIPIKDEVNLQIVMKEIELEPVYLIGDVIGDIEYVNDPIPVVTMGICIMEDPELELPELDPLEMDSLEQIKVEEVPILLPKKEPHDQIKHPLPKEKIGKAIIESKEETIEIEEEKDKDLSLTVFPNPGTGDFRIELEEHQVYDFQIMDNLGQVILEGKTEGQNIKFDLSGHSSGIYHVKVFTNQELIGSSQFILSR